VGALYGILGEADAGEVGSIGDRLLHRGDRVSEWSVGPLLRLGMRTRIVGVERLAGGPIVFDGAIDNHPDLPRHPGGHGVAIASAVNDALLALNLFHREGTDAFARLAGQFALAIADPSARAEILVRSDVAIGVLPRERFPRSRGRCPLHRLPGTEGGNL